MTEKVYKKIIDAGPMTLLPPAPGVCQVCARDHEPEIPHDKTSLYYQTKFYMKTGRVPTWDDAMAHCTEEVKRTWKESMERVKETTKHLGIEI